MTTLGAFMLKKETDDEMGNISLQFAFQDIRQLFTFGDEDSTTETSNIFQGAGEDLVLNTESGLNGCVSAQTSSDPQKDHLPGILGDF